MNESASDFVSGQSKGPLLTTLGMHIRRGDFQGGELEIRHKAGGAGL